MTPAWSISADGVDITSRFNDRLLELTVTDNEGLKSDSCEILVDDRDGQLAIPRKGAILAISMGYRETGLTFMGSTRSMRSRSPVFPARCGFLPPPPISARN